MAFGSGEHVSHGNSRVSNRRAFVPQEWFYPAGTPLEDITQEGPELVHLRCPRIAEPCKRCGRRAYHNDTFVIAVDGACPGNGTSKNIVFSSAGVYVGHDHPFNEGFTLVDRGATNQRAELRASILGLQTALDLRLYDHAKSSTPTLVIKTDSVYVYNGITTLVSKWKTNGWKNAAKKDVANRDLWETLDSSTEDLERRGISVLFWSVPRTFNKEADSLANQGYAVVKGCGLENRLDRTCGGDLELKFQIGKRLVQEIS